MIVGNLSRDDRSGLVEVYRECFLAPPRQEHWTPDQVSVLLDDLMARGARGIAVVEEDQAIVGYSLGLPLRASELADELTSLGAPAEAFYLAHLAVRERVRGRGVGRLLVRRILDEVAETYPRVVVRCRTDAEAVRRLLASEGFAEIARYQATTGGVTSDRLVLLRGSGGPR